MFEVEHIFQIVSIIGGTFLLEDATALSVGLLIIDGQLSAWVGFIGLVLGITIGDILLFCAGRFRCSRRFMIRRIPRRQLRRARRLFRRHVAEALVIARFTPGMRFPTYVAAGLLRVPMLTFVTFVTILSFLWISFLGVLLFWLGEQWVKELLDWWGLPLVILALVLIVVIVKIGVRRAAGTPSESNAHRRDG